MPTLTLAIIGAGPFGLATAAMARSRGISCQVFGKPLELWRRHMPDGMLLRSASDWHLDPLERNTFHAYLAERRIASNGEPIALPLFLDYAAWFIERTGIGVDTRLVRSLSRNGGTFELELQDGSRLRAANVLCAPGVRYFRTIPDHYHHAIADHQWCHSTDVRELDGFREKRVLIIGGRQSAYELATLLALHAAADVTIVHRHPAPAFTDSDWSWVPGELKKAEATPGWFAGLAAEEQQAIQKRFWSEGRLKLEPWIGERLARARLTVHASTAIESVSDDDGRVMVKLEGGTILRGIDRLVLATGFKVDLQRVPYLMPALLAEVESTEGAPRLGTHMQSVSVPNLYFAGLVAARDFGPYMGFLAAVPFAARTIVSGVERGGQKVIES